MYIVFGHVATAVAGQPRKFLRVNGNDGEGDGEPVDTLARATLFQLTFDGITVDITPALPADFDGDVWGPHPVAVRLADGIPIATEKVRENSR